MRTSVPDLDRRHREVPRGMVRGIGPVYAKKMVKAFGEQVFSSLPLLA
jgi:hypothetical protein